MSQSKQFLGKSDEKVVHAMSMSKPPHFLDNHNEKVELILEQATTQPGNTGIGNAAKKVEPSITNQTATPVDTGISDGLAKALIGGVVGVVVGTLAAALANKKTVQSVNDTVKSVGDAVKGAAGSVAKGVNDTAKSAGNAVKSVGDAVKSAAGSVAKGANDTAKSAMDTVKATGENVKSAEESTVERVKDTVEDAQPSTYQSIKLYEERLVADTKQVKTASVSIGKHVETELAHICVPVRKERLVVEQMTPVDAEMPVASGEADFYEGEIARLEIYEEAADVQKLTFVREEVSVRKAVDHNTIEVEDTIRREELDLDIQDSNGIENAKTL